MKTTLIIVRHGEAEFNIAHRIHGKLDSPLTEEGVRQAQKAAAALAGIPIDAIYSSPQQRVVTTTGILKLDRNCPVTYDQRLAEMDCGAWDGKTEEFIRAEYPDDMRLWETRPHLHTMPGGESLADVRARLTDFLDGVLKANRGKTVLVVSSQVPVMMMTMIFAQEPDEALWQTPPQGNTAINVVEMDDAGSATILRRGDVGHV
jgi:broad specificity phosphatase PhoE